MLSVFFSTKNTTIDIKKVGTDLALCYATLCTTFFKVLKGVSKIRAYIYLGYLAVYIIAKEAPMLNNKKMYLLPHRAIFLTP
jgi:hypothetical protein